MSKKRNVKISSILLNPFRPKKNIQRGKVAKIMGERFENMIKNACYKSLVVCTRIPDGCKVIKRRGAIGLQRVKSPFDFVLTYKGIATCIDCKTIEMGNFSYSELKPHQVDELFRIYKSGVNAGYLIWFRQTDKLIFFDASKLRALTPRSSLKETDGVLIGSADNIEIRRILIRIEGQSWT